MSPPSEHQSAGSWISQTDTGSTGSSTGAGGDTEYASDTPSDDNTEAGTEEGENIGEVTCDNTIEEEAETPDRHFLDSEPVSHVSDTSHEWRREDENKNKYKNEDNSHENEDKDSEEDNEGNTYNETDESFGASIQMDDVSSVENDNIEAFKEEEMEEKSADFNHNKDKIMIEVLPTDIDDKGKII